MELNTRIKNYWEGEAETYSDAVSDELVGEERRVWTELVLSNAPAKEPLDILDIGTGPGFFPIILSKAGHNVTGIDITENMIAFAKQNMEREGVEAVLMTMDCQNLTFADDSFDLVVCRNLTWTLDNPQRAYSEWLRVLRPGGRMLVFDANWYCHLYDEELAALYRQKEEEMQAKYGRSVHQHKDQEEGDALSGQLFMSDKTRPEWDLAKLLELGFSRVFADMTVGDKTCDACGRIMAEIHRHFMVGAEK